MRVILGIDMNDDGVAEVLEQATQVCAALDASMDVAFVDGASHLQGLAVDPAAAQILQHHTEKLRAHNEAQLKTWVASLPAKLQARPLYRFGGAADEVLCEEGRTHDLVVVGTHGRTGLQRLLLGSISERVVRRAQRPVLVLREPSDASTGALLAVDLYEPEVQRRVDRAGRWAQRFGTTLDLVYVAPDFGSGWWAPELRDQLTRETARIEERERSQLASLLELLPETSRGAVHRVAGRPAESIVELAGDFELLITFTHGRTGLQHLLLGSVAERVVRTAPTTTLVLPGS